MKRFFALFIARNKEFYRDHGTLGWTFLFPFIVIAGFAFGYKGNSDTVFKIGLFQDGQASGEVESAIQNLRDSQTMQFVEIKTVESGVKKVQLHQIDFLIAESARLKYWVNPESAKGRLVEKLLVSGNPHPELLEKQVVQGRAVRYVEWLVPGILAMNMMFSSLFGVGYTIVRYRKNGVLKRLKATPVTAFQFLSAQLVSRLILILLTSMIVFVGSTRLIGFEMQGSYFALFSYLGIGAGCMITLGLVFASRISSEELAEGLLNLLTWPMMFLSGIWFSLDGASRPIVWLSNVFPLTHIVAGSRQIMIDGASLGSLLPSILILSGMGLVFLVLGSLLFKWE
ncbi:MAG: ABC transporter permease [Bdellovibrionales bacterium]|nr:ABC transporter permease [Oligoflexia bacterium]